jgi:hypothetical protein
MTVCRHPEVSNSLRQDGSLAQDRHHNEEHWR